MRYENLIPIKCLQLNLKRNRGFIWDKNCTKILDRGYTMNIYKLVCMESHIVLDSTNIQLGGILLWGFLNWDSSKNDVTSIFFFTSKLLLPVAARILIWKSFHLFLPSKLKKALSWISASEFMFSMRISDWRIKCNY